MVKADITPEEAWQNHYAAFLTSMAEHSSLSQLRVYRHVLHDFLLAVHDRPDRASQRDLATFTNGLPARHRGIVQKFLAFARPPKEPKPNPKPKEPKEPKPRKATREKAARQTDIALLDGGGDDWQKCATGFLAHIYSKSHSARSRHQYRAILAQFFGDGKKPPDKGRGDVERFIESPCQSTRNRGGPPTPATRNNRLTIIRSFYHYAAGYQVSGPDGRLTPIMQPYDPTAGIYTSKTAKNARSLTVEEIKAFFAAIPSGTVIGARDRAAFLFFFWSARRRAEVCRLRWGDIESTTIVDEQGACHEGVVYRFTGKGKGGAIDTAELPQPAYDALMHYLNVSGRLATMKPASPLFVAIGPPRGGRSCDPDAPLHSSTIAWALKRYALAAGIPKEKISIHVFRHAAAQQRFRSGQDIRSISHLLRHSSLATTDIYLRELCGTADDVPEKLLSKFGNL